MSGTQSVKYGGHENLPLRSPDSGSASDQFSQLLCSEIHCVHPETTIPKVTPSQ